MNMNDVKIECLSKKHTGMQPVTVWNDIRVTHIPTGIVVEIPHGFSQNRNTKIALAMLDVAVAMWSK